MTRFCTATDDSSPKCRASAFVTCPCSGPKTSSTFASRRSATVRARSTNSRVQLARGLLELRAYELGVGARLLAVEHARADLDRLDDEARRILTLGGEPDGRLVVDRQPVDREAAVDDVDPREGERGGSFHSHRVARYGPHLTDRTSSFSGCASPTSAGGPCAGARAGWRAGCARARAERLERLDALVQRDDRGRHGRRALHPRAAVHVDALALAPAMRARSCAASSMWPGSRLP